MANLNKTRLETEERNGKNSRPISGVPKYAKKGTNESDNIQTATTSNANRAKASKKDYEEEKT